MRKKFSKPHPQPRSISSGTPMSATTARAFLPKPLISPATCLKGRPVSADQDEICTGFGESFCNRLPNASTRTRYDCCFSSLKETSQWMLPSVMGLVDLYPFLSLVDDSFRLKGCSFKRAEGHESDFRCYLTFFPQPVLDLRGDLRNVFLLSGIRRQSCKHRPLCLAPL